MSKIINILIFLVYINSSFGINVDSLLSVSKTDKEKANTYLLISNDLYSANKPTDKYPQLALDYALKSNDKETIGDVYLLHGTLKKDTGDYKGSIKSIKLAISNLVDVGAEVKIAGAYNIIGATYYYIGNLQKAAESWEQALLLFVKNNINSSAAGCYSNLGIVYNNIGNNEKALANFKKSASIFEIEENKIPLTHLYVNIGIIESENGNYESAINYIEKSIYLKKVLKDEKGLSVAYNNIGVAYTKTQRYKTALDYFNKALFIKQKYKDIKGILLTYRNIADNYIAQKDYNEALNITLKGLSVVNNTEYINEKSSFYKLLTDIYGKMGLKSKANAYDIRYHEITDSLSKLQDSLLISSILQNTDSLDLNEEPDFIELRVKNNIDSFIIFSILGLLIIVLIFVLIIRGKQNN